MDWLERTTRLRQWTRNGTRAPHKPLLLLYALGRFQEDADSELRYSAVEEDLQRLLTEYGPPNKTSPAYPSHHLVSDGVWEVRTDRGPGSPGSGLRELRASGATGRLAPDLGNALLRELVLTAYEYRCAFCGYDGRIGAVPVGLEAAHVRWWAFGGPDDVDNGLCLCSLHHKLFDKGVLGVDDSHRILVSQRFVGHSTAARDHVVALAGRPVIGPQSAARPVADSHRAWHTSQVFHGAPRLAPPPD
jgi:putative restriction endonuclease